MNGYHKLLAVDRRYAVTLHTQYACPAFKSSALRQRYWCSKRGGGQRHQEQLDGGWNADDGLVQRATSDALALHHEGGLFLDAHLRSTPAFGTGHNGRAICRSRNGSFSSRLVIARLVCSLVAQACRQDGHAEAMRTRNARRNDCAASYDGILSFWLTN